MSFEIQKQTFLGPRGALPIDPNDEVALKFAMLIEGECGPQTRLDVARRYGYSRQRYFQLRTAFSTDGTKALVSDKRGPKTHYRRSMEVVCQVIRHRYLDRDASSAVITQKLRQCGFKISKRSVDRVFAEYGLQKKTLSISPRPRPGGS